MKLGLGRVDEVSHFFWTQDAGEMSRFLGVRSIGHDARLALSDRLCVAWQPYRLQSFPEES